MGLNLEIKLRTEISDLLFDNIKKLGGKFIDTLNQKDIYFNYAHGLMKLRVQNGSYWLIKYKRDENSKDRWSNYSILTLKGDNIEDYLIDIFDCEITVEKKRDLYLYKNTRIHIDTIRNLGEYIELETVVNKISHQEAKMEFNYVLETLQLDKTKEIRKSYRDLLFNK